jgi:hypothetical protein
VVIKVWANILSIKLGGIGYDFIYFQTNDRHFVMAYIIYC